MDTNDLAFLAVVLGVFVGLAVLLYGEAAGAGMVVVLGGGTIVLLAMALLTVILARMGGGEAADH